MHVDRQLAAYFHEQVLRIVAPVVQVPFSPPALAVDDSVGQVIVSFVANNLALQLLLDAREGDVECKIARVVDGRVTNDYAHDSEGRRVRIGLTELLRLRGAAQPLLRGVSGFDLRDQIRITLEDLARLLREQGRDILADSASALQ